MSEVRSDLIYDVGLFDGQDTAYYLFRGFKVLAIDANPLMIEKAELKFQKELRSEQLTLLNVGITSTSGTSTFWVSEKPEWSSFNRFIASREGTLCKPVVVPTLPFTQLLTLYGIPHYLKIDIEGNDPLCVEALRGFQIPKYLSVESECVDDSTVLSDEEALAMLELLRDVGYRRFKLVDQLTRLPVRSKAASTMMRICNSAARGRLRVPGLSKIAESLSEADRIAKLGFGFHFGSSGPWGDDIPARWMSFEKARTMYLHARRAFFKGDRPLYKFWYDWHATY